MFSFKKRPASEKVNLPKDGFVFVVTYGRSGSTLTQRLLNQIPGYCIRGENGNAFYYLAKTMDAVAKQPAIISRQEFSKMPKRQRPEHIGKLIGKDHDPWFGIELIDHEELRISLRDTFCRLILSLPQDCRVGGFKEIRYHHHQKYFANYMDALRRTFPDTRIIFQTREWTQVAKSAWWKKWDPARVEDIVTTSDANFMKYQNAYPEHCFTVTYEKLVGGTDHARTLIDFLGEELPESAISSILQEKLTH